MIGRIPEQAKPWLAGTVATGVLVILGLVAQYWLVSRLFVDDVVSIVQPVLLAMLALLLMRFGLILIHRYIGAHTASEVKQSLRQQLLDKLARLQPSLLTPELRGRLNYLLGEGVEVLDLYWGLFVPQFFIGLLGPLLVCGFIALIDPFSGMVLFMMIPLIPGILMMVFKRFANVSATYKQNLAQLTELFTQSLHGLPVLKLYQFSKSWGGQIENHGEKLRRSTMSLLKTNQLVILLVDLLFSLGTIIAASLLAITRFQSGAIDTASAAFIIIASIELIRPLSLMGAFFFAGALGREVQTDVQSILALEEIRLTKPHKFNDARVLDIKAASFHYPNQSWQLNNVNLTVFRGELVVIKGPSGSGKSTLFKLIQGQLTAQEGEIKAAEMGYLQQSPYIFNGSLADNCRMADRAASDTDIQQALSYCALSDWLMVPNALEREPGEGGKSISGGQAARIGLSRAFLSQYALLLIDEPTRQLDGKTEMQIIQALHVLKQNSGVVVVSHSQRLLQQADRVIDIEHWRPVTSKANKQEVMA